MSATVTPDIPAAPALPPRKRVKRLRLAAIVFAALLLGLVSFVFGLFISVASDLPSLERFSQIKDAQSSQLLDDLGHPIGVLTEQNPVILTPSQIPPTVKQAVISLQANPFYSTRFLALPGIPPPSLQHLA